MNKQELKDLQVVIAKQEAEKTKELLRSFEKTPRTIYKRWLVASSIIVFIGFLSFWFLNSSSPNSEELFAKYFAPYENVVEPISRTDKTQNTKTLAFENYELGNYIDALNGFNLLVLDEKENKEVVNFYKAISYLKLNQPQKTIDLLKNNFKNNLKWKDKNDWYLALAYLKTNNQTETKRILKALSQEKTNFKKEATLTLLKSLK